MSEKTMDDLIAEAEKKGLWLHTSYQDIWFSPAKLRLERAAGRFLWGATNWTLRDPQEYLAEAELKVIDAELFRDRVKKAVQS